MGNGRSKVNVVQSKVSVSSDLSQQPSSKNLLYRLPTDNQSVKLGSFYDARTDCLLKDFSLGVSPKSIEVRKYEHTTIIKSSKFPNRNLPRIIDIDAELYVSLILNIAPQIGITSIFNFLLSTNTSVVILYYCYVSRENYMQETSKYAREEIPKFIENTTATHVVTAIKTGIHVVIVSQLPSNNESDVITIFEEIKRKLSEDHSEMPVDEKSLPKELNCIKVFSNIPDIAKSIKLTDVYQKIIQFKSLASKYILGYTLEPIEYFYPRYLSAKAIFTSLNPDIIKQIENCLYDLLMIKKPWETHFDSEMEKSLNKHLQQQLREVQNQISNAQGIYESTIQNIRDLVVKSRTELHSQDSAITALFGESFKELLNEIKSVNERRDALQEKAKLIADCDKQGIKYSNIAGFFVEGEDILETIQQQLLDRKKRKRIFCCDDDLKKKDVSQWNDFYTKLINERDSNSELDLVYADFSYCSYRLSQIKILSSNDISERRSSWPSKPSLPSPKLNDSNKINSQNTDFINVLLLGESGVGKSTFINAIVNYLHFESLKEAQLGQPIVLTPVSFLITEGDNFKERIVRFGDKDPNENHNQSGQSVTQQCRSYVFTIDNQTKIRLIDTPGMGDTRGLDQDDLNMQHILSFVNNLSHLNAICILLKPNESKLNVVLRSYFTRLVGFLGEHSRHNIIFCFTNTRATFFAPGDTGPLLKKMLQSQSIKDIPFEKRNTFCFDSESFRYLVAQLNGVKFDDYQKEEYKQSWITSANESNRLLKYICTEIKSYLQNDWQSIEHAQFQITLLVRPMLETIRNTMRNITILEKTSSKSLIKLHSNPVSSNSSVCLECKRLKFLDKFWVILDELHVLSSRCEKCSCDLSRHSKVDYLITYEICDDRGKQSLDKLKTNLNQLKEAITKFVYFFKNVARISKENDPILSALDGMINEENYICTRKGSDVLNSQLRESLENLRKEYEKLWTTSASSQKSMPLSEIYNQIKNVSENATINEQLDAIKQTQEFYMTEQERNIS